MRSSTDNIPSFRHISKLNNKFCLSWFCTNILFTQEVMWVMHTCYLSRMLLQYILWNNEWALYHKARTAPYLPTHMHVFDIKAGIGAGTHFHVNYPQTKLHSQIVFYFLWWNEVRKIRGSMFYSPLISLRFPRKKSTSCMCLPLFFHFIDFLVSRQVKSGESGSTEQLCKKKVFGSLSSHSFSPSVSVSTRKLKWHTFPILDMSTRWKRANSHKSKKKSNEWVSYLKIDGREGEERPCMLPINYSQQVRENVVVIKVMPVSEKNQRSNH